MKFSAKLFLVISLSLSPASVFAASAPIFPASGAGKATQFTSADTPGTYKTIFTAGASGAKCIGITLHWNDQGAAHIVTLRTTLSSTSVDLLSLTTTIGAASGTLGVPLSFFDPGAWPGLPADGTGGNPILLLANGDTVSATYTTAVTAAYAVSVIAQCQNF